MSLLTCNAQTPEKPVTTDASKNEIQVYYFHFTNRCATCNAVENETMFTLNSFYADKMKEGKIDFTSLNLDEDEGKDMAKELGVSGQTLLLVRGVNKVNLTNDGFMHARANPAKFQELLKSQIDKLL